MRAITAYVISARQTKRLLSLMARHYLPARNVLIVALCANELPTLIKRIIVGGPKTGKTTLAGNNENTRHTDDCIVPGSFHTSDYAVSKVVEWINDPVVHTIEGVQCARGLRLWLASNVSKPCEEIVWLEQPKVTLTKGQAIMQKGIDTIMQQIVPELVSRGVKIVRESK
jgi:hypothetical protein